jgi:FkbM family methyltransferase
VSSEESVGSTAATLVRLIWRHPANRRHRVRALLGSIGWQVYKRTLRRPIWIQAFGSMRLRCYPDDHEASRFIYFNRFPDFHEMRFMQRFLRPGDRFIDCGAHIGSYSLLAAAIVGSQWVVEAFEAAPRALQRLKENIAASNVTCVRVHACAVSDRSGAVAFVADRKGGTGNRIVTPEDDSRVTVEVPAVRLDDVLNEAPYAMAKLDIEGAEALALQGANRLLRDAASPVWQLELVDLFIRRFGSSVHQVIEYLASLGYEIGVYDAGNNVLQLGPHMVETRTNVLAIARSSLDLVARRVGCRTRF